MSTRREPPLDGWIRTWVEIEEGAGEPFEALVDVRVFSPEAAIALRALAARSEKEIGQSGQRSGPASDQLYTLVLANVAFVEVRHQIRFADRTARAQLGALLRVNS